VERWVQIMGKLIINPMPIGYHVLPNDEVMFIDEIILLIYHRQHQQASNRSIKS
jgi:hypothetical protein